MFFQHIFKLTRDKITLSIIVFEDARDDMRIGWGRIRMMIAEGLSREMKKSLQSK